MIPAVGPHDSKVTEAPPLQTQPPARRQESKMDLFFFFFFTSAVNECCLTSTTTESLQLHANPRNKSDHINMNNCYPLVATRSTSARRDAAYLTHARRDDQIVLFQKCENGNEAIFDQPWRLNIHSDIHKTVWQLSLPQELQNWQEREEDGLWDGHVRCLATRCRCCKAQKQRRARSAHQARSINLEIIFLILA